MKQCLAFAGMIFLMGTVLPAKKLPAATGKSHFTSPELTYARTDTPHPATNRGFLDNIYLSLDQPAKTPATDLKDTSLNLQRDLPTGSFDKLQPMPDHAAKPMLTVADRKLDYQLYGSEGFALKLNLAPEYPNPEAPMPTRLDPGFGISIKF